MTNRISSLKELMNEVSYNWNYPQYDFDFDKEDNSFSLDKLYISSDLVQYKTSTYELAPGVFEQFKKFVMLLNAEV